MDDATAMHGWKLVTAKPRRSAKDAAVILRKTSIQFNAACMEKLDLVRFTHVRLFVDREDRRIGFVFLTETTAGAYSLNSDGGAGKNNTARILQVKSFLQREAWVQEFIKATNSVERALIPVPDDAMPNMWAIRLPPM